MSNFPLEIVRLLFRWSIYFINNIMSRTFVLVPILDEFTYGAIKYKYSQSREFNSRRLKGLAWSLFEYLQFSQISFWILVNSY